MEELKLQVVREYLNTNFSGSKIDENYDFDRGAQTFRIRTDKNLLLLKVGEEFLSDNSEVKLLEYLINWEVASLLTENKELGILICNTAPISFSR